MKIGDTIEFGRYFYETEEEKLPVSWRVIGEREDAFLLITEKVIDWAEFNYHEPIMWSYSFCRFCHRMMFLEMFNETEQKQIIETDVITSEKLLYDESDICPDKGAATKDFLFPLSAYEALKYFDSDQDRKAAPTPYAQSQGAYKEKTTGCSCWWLRSRGYSPTCTSDVLPNGEICASGDEVEEGGGIRPAMWLKKC